MKNRTIKSAFFASLIILSFSCFVYVNTAPIERALSVEMIDRPIKTDAAQADESSKMPDLAFVKGVLSIIQTFFPAK